MFSDFTGVILAGGQSSRMGYDKLLCALRSGGRNLIQTTTDIMSRLFSEVVIIGPGDRTDRFAGCTFTRSLPDKMANAGPMGGLDTALSSITTPYAFIVSADMPFLSESFIRYELRAFLEHQPVPKAFIPVTRRPDQDHRDQVPKHGFRATERRAPLLSPPPPGMAIEPLHAVYAASLAETVHACLEAQQRQLVQAIGALPPGQVVWWPWQPAPPGVFDGAPADDVFFNVNTPEDLRAAATRLGPS
ncbi:putative MobA-like NTP transferase domain [Paratrimastix pyriformis]|uniref:MobA-like NTP transferase domain n=1 Tax=Paratrimastix pyriformis TaxID=342808 RepID=A0ABQ8UUT1_9EUKA|nr:putative MobA-like NTP transferase domain [Paratrimastix pyriformis]